MAVSNNAMEVGSGTEEELCVSFERVPVNVATPLLISRLAVTLLALRSKDPPEKLNNVGFVNVIVTLPEFPVTDPVRSPTIGLPVTPGGAVNVTAKSKVSPL